MKQRLAGHGDDLCKQVDHYCAVSARIVPSLCKSVCNFYSR